MNEPAVERDVTVVVPVHDERVEFEEILSRYAHEFEKRGLTHEFVFVLDGTPDALFEELGRRRPAGMSVRLIKFNQPFGESIALAAGFKIARGRTVLSLPQYLQTDPADVQKILDALDQGADVVTCWRRGRVDPFLNRIQSWFFNSLMRVLTRTRVHDLNCLARAMRRRVFEDVAVQGDMYRFLPVLAYRAGYEVAEVRVRHVKEQGGSVFGSLFGFGVYLRRILDIAALIFLTRFTRKPLRFFGLAGGGIFVVGLLICLYLLFEFFWFGDNDATRLKNRTWLIFGTLMIVLGVQTFFIGLVAEIVIFTQGRNLKDYKISRIAEGTGPTHVVAPAGDAGAAGGNGPAKLVDGGGANGANGSTPSNGSGARGGVPLHRPALEPERPLGSPAARKPPEGTKS
jgi:glycosyltransferase involved in cell wall biosynthesis